MGVLKRRGIENRDAPHALGVEMTAIYRPLAKTPIITMYENKTHVGGFIVCGGVLHIRSIGRDINADLPMPIHKTAHI